MAIALLIARLIVGLGLAAHGAQKLFGWFGGYGPKGTGGFMESLGFRPGIAFAVAAGLGEFGGGLLTALGLGGPIGPALIVMVMLVAVLTVHISKGWWQSNGGFELNFNIIAASIVLALAGPGVLSLDAALGINGIWSDALRWGVMGLGLVLALLNLAVRHTEKKTQTA